MSRTERLACLCVLAGLGALGCGGKVTGGMGGTAVGGIATGGTSTGGATGSYATGGTATGGISTGGTTTGGHATGGTATGGISTGGTAVGGYVTGGTTTGGIGTGGTATGGTGTGGAPTGGTGGVAVCQTVDSLPEQYSACGSTPGESRCLANGNRCVCWRNVWYCNVNCPNVPEPTLLDDCSALRGTACSYPDGADCACMNNQWYCTGSRSICPDPNSGIPSSVACDRPGLACDYPDSSPSFGCLCVPSYRDASDDSSWDCFVSGSCPATQPVYPTACTSTRLCTYGNVHCACANGGTWICDWPLVLTPPPSQEYGFTVDEGRLQFVRSNVATKGAGYRLDRASMAF